MQRALMEANEVAQMDKDSCIIFPFSSKPIIDKKYKPFHDPSYIKSKEYGPYKHPVEVIRDEHGKLLTVNHTEKFYFPDQNLQKKIQADSQKGDSDDMLFRLSEDEFCALNLDDPILERPEGNLFLLEQIKTFESQSTDEKLQKAAQEKAAHKQSYEATPEDETEPSVYEIRQSWDISGSLEDVIRRYIMDFSDEEIAEITEAMNSHVSEKKIKDCLKLPPEKLRLMLQFYVQQQHKKGA